MSEDGFASSHPLSCPSYWAKLAWHLLKRPPTIILLELMILAERRPPVPGFGMFKRFWPRISHIPGIPFLPVK